MPTEQMYWYYYVRQDGAEKWRVIASTRPVGKRYPGWQPATPNRVQQLLNVRQIGRFTALDFVELERKPAPTDFPTDLCAWVERHPNAFEVVPDFPKG